MRVVCRREQPREAGAGFCRFQKADAANSLGPDQPLRSGGQPETFREDAGG